MCWDFRLGKHIERKSIDISIPGFSEVCFGTPNNFYWSCTNSHPVEWDFLSLPQSPWVPSVAGEEVTVWICTQWGAAALHCCYHLCSCSCLLSLPLFSSSQACCFWFSCCCFLFFVLAHMEWTNLKSVWAGVKFTAIPLEFIPPYTALSLLTASFRLTNCLCGVRGREKLGHEEEQKINEQINKQN